MCVPGGKVIEVAHRRRATAGTDINAGSSRSHSVVQALADPIRVRVRVRQRGPGPR